MYAQKINKIRWNITKDIMNATRDYKLFDEPPFIVQLKLP